MYRKYIIKLVARWYEPTYYGSWFLMGDMVELLGLRSSPAWQAPVMQGPRDDIVFSRAGVLIIF